MIRDVIGRCIDTSTRLMTAHFASPAAGWGGERQGQVRFKFDVKNEIDQMQSNAMKKRPMLKGKIEEVKKTM